jgi:tRNA (guanine-N7-)-methyltransferase
MSPTRAAAYARLVGEWSHAETGLPLDLHTVFGRTAPVVLDIGFGGGETTIALARARPDEDVLAIDVHTPGVGRLLEAIERDGLRNVRVVEGDATIFVERLPPASLAEVRVLFPDPWPKVRQRHRRLLSERFVAALVDRLAPGGSLHVATDVEDYARHVLAVCAADGRLAGGIVARPAWRPTTRFEQRALDEGRSAIDLRFTRS